jgi:uncharacterized protein YjbI with pentapeptide repeats
MTNSHSRTLEDVRNWPADPAARKALQEYLEALPLKSENSPLSLAGGELDFSGADLSGLYLAGAQLGEAKLSGARLVDADLYSAWLVQATLRGTDLSGCDRRKVDGRACDARNAIFRGARLARAGFEDSDFRGADLSGADFGRAALGGSDLRGADLRNCVFGPSVSPTDLEEARLADCLLSGATGYLYGPVDIGADTPRLVNGSELKAWFVGQGVPDVEVAMLS